MFKMRSFTLQSGTSSFFQKRLLYLYLRTAAAASEPGASVQGSDLFRA